MMYFFFFSMMASGPIYFFSGNSFSFHSITLNRIHGLTETEGADAQSARAAGFDFLHCFLVESRLAGTQAVQCHAICLSQQGHQFRLVVLGLDAVRSNAVQLVQVRIKAEVFSKQDVIASVLVDAQRVLFAGFV